MTSAQISRPTITTRAARAITEISGPGVCVLLSLMIVAIHDSARSGAAAAWGGVAAFLCAGIPMGVIIHGARRGRWSDHHVGEREKRAIPLLVGLASVAAAIALLVIVDAPRDLIALVVAMLVGLTLVFVITRWWKVSIHTSVAAGFLGILSAVYGPIALAGLPVLAAVAWSRTVLDAHTWAQVIAGACVGWLTAVTIFPLLR